VSIAFSFHKHHWALILGGSSGFGLATAQKLARHGMNVCVVHRDRRGAMLSIEQEFEKIRQTGVGFVAINGDALSAEGRKGALDALVERMGGEGRVRLLMHSIAYGNLKPIAPVPAKEREATAQARTRLAERLSVTPSALQDAIKAIVAEGHGDELAHLVDPPAYDEDALLDDEDFARTVYSMGTSLATWTQDVLRRRLFADDARVIGMTSEGNEVAWRGYAAVSAAKVALESVSRTIATELAPYGIRSNIVQAGVTDTPALRLIPGSERMKAEARLRNPFGRLTTPGDVGDFIALLCTDEARWVNGALIRVDGGERISG
jgi:NAD(P)-dependent dehydrogenase (short-subunit alcohol dehydrogenase family)